MLNEFLLARMAGWPSGRPASPATVRRYRWSIEGLLRAAPTLDESDVYAYLVHLRESCRSPWTFHAAIRDIRAFLRWAVETGRLARAPRIAPPREPRTLPRVYTREDVEAVMGVASGRDLVILHVLLDCGLRARELCHLRRRDVNVDGRWVRVLGKGGKERYVGMGRRTAQLLADWMARDPGASPDAYLFPGRGGRPLTTGALWAMVRRRCAEAGVSVPRAVHAWRHTFATEAYARGADAADLRDELGHSSYRTLDVYRHTAAVVRARRHEAYSPVD